MNEKTFKFEVGATVFMKRHPAIPWIVIRRSLSPARKDFTYTVRAVDNPSDERGFLVWEDALS
jgi:hypothetical protein